MKKSLSFFPLNSSFLSGWFFVLSNSSSIETLIIGVSSSCSVNFFSCLLSDLSLKNKNLALFSLRVFLDHHV
ncbi:TPA: hypothetical protein DIC40_00160 [Patescibacteria group bacterium]|nr:hypothetical protein [Candidatus Gracilibacteria bacterium]